jgi:hypothetical protein
MKIDRLRPNTGVFWNLLFIFQYVAVARPQNFDPRTWLGLGLAELSNKGKAQRTL